MKDEQKLVHHHFSGEPCKACEQAGKQEGIREVVEYIEKNYPIGTPKWQAQLKTWGIKQ